MFIITQILESLDMYAECLDDSTRTTPALRILPTGIALILFLENKVTLCTISDLATRQLILPALNMFYFI